MKSQSSETGAIVNPTQDVSAGDRAVAGLFGGWGSGSAMALFLVIAGLLRGEPAALTLSRFAITPGGQALAGTLTHLAVAGVYGLVFGLGWSAAPRYFSGNRGWLALLAGVGYGALLWLAARSLILPGSGSLLRDIPAGVFLAAHLIYGALLGWLVGRG
jgi:hypothetical protein